MKRNYIGLLAALIILLVFYLMPNPEGLSAAGKMAWGMMLAGIALWVSEAVPLGVAALLLMVIMPYLGILDFNTVFAKFISSVIFFLIGVFALTTALAKTTIPERIIGVMLKKTGRTPSRVVLAFMLGTALISAVMTDIATCALVLSLGIVFLKSNKDVPGKSNLGRCIMLGIPFASVIGGIITPVGSANNIMALSMVADYTGIKVAFIHWMIMGIPMAVIMLPICWWILVHTFKPEEVTEEAWMSVMQSTELGPLNSRDKWVLLILLLEIIAWIVSSWVPAINTAAVAIIAMAAMFLPGVRVLTLEDIEKGIPWNLVLLVGGVQAIAGAIIATGGAKWLLDVALVNVANNMGQSALISLASTLAAVIHLFVPVGPANVGLNMIPMTDIAMAAGLSPVVMVVMVSMMSSGTYLLPYDCIPLLTYKEGYYSVKEMIKVGWVPTLTLILYCTFILPLFCSMLGY